MFPITISFTVSTPAELARLVAATGNPASPEVPPLPGDKPKKGTTVPKEGTTEKPGGGEHGPKSETAAASAAQPAGTQATQAPTGATSGGEAAQIDYDKDVKPAFLKLVQTKGRQAGRKIIDAFAPTKEKLSEAITTQEQYRQALEFIAKELGDA